MEIELEPDDWPADEVWATAVGAEASSEIVLVPESLDSGAGLYRGELTQVVKELTASGIKASFAQTPDARMWREVKGHGEITLLISVAAGVLSAASWDLMKAVFLRLFGSDQLRIFIKVRRRSGTRAKVRLRGTGKDVVDALDRLPKVLDDSPD